MAQGRVRRVAVAVLAALVAGSLIRADRISLRGGGQVRGKVLPDPAKADGVIVLTERGKTPLRFQKAQIVQVEPEPSALDEYVKRRETAPATAEGQYELGLWCEEHKLPDLAGVHYEAAVAKDGAFAAAWKKLGYELVGERWLKGDALREAKGLVRYKGRWITPEERAEHEKSEAEAGEAAEWARRIRQLRDAYVNSASDRHREAEKQLMEIRDAAAVGPLMRVLGDDIDPVRSLLAHVLGAIPGDASASALVRLLLAEDDADVRHVVLDQLERRKEPEIGKQLVKGLNGTPPAVVNRAAWALANLRQASAVPSLVNALVTSVSQMVMEPSTAGGGGGAVGMGGGYNTGGNFNAGFGGVFPPPTDGNGGVLAAYNGGSVAYLNGPAVGPGVIAFGATSYPVYNMPAYNVPSSTSFLNQYAQPGVGVGVPGGGGLNASRGPVPRMVTTRIQNVEVREALTKLTGQDFGFDVDAWKRWVRTSFNADPNPARRVPQP